MAAISNSDLIKVLVTGSNGQLGSEFKGLALNYKDLEFIFTDVESLDITRAEEISAFLKELKPNFIVNCAGYTAVDKAESDAKNAFVLNADAPLMLAQEAKKIGLKLIHISTDYVFDGKSWEPYAEDKPTSPNSVYGESKLKGEEAVLRTGVGMIIRTSWLYSAFGHNFVKTIALKGKTVENLRVVYDQIGSPTWARDLALAIIFIIQKGVNQFLPEIYHYSNEGVCSWFDFAKEIVDYYQFNSIVTPVLSSEFPTQASRPPYSVLNKAKIKNAYNLAIPHWKDSLHSCLDRLNY